MPREMRTVSEGSSIVSLAPKALNDLLGLEGMGLIREVPGTG